MEEVQDAVKNQLLEEKHRTLDEFLRRLKKQAVWERIAKVILYGSVLRRDAGEESDIDILLVSTGDLREVQEVAFLRLRRGTSRREAELGGGRFEPQHSPGILAPT